MLLEKLTIEESARGGYTHQAVITYADLAALPTGAGSAQTIALMSMAASQVFGRISVNVATAFTVSDSGTTLTVGLTDAGSNDLIGSSPSLLTATFTNTANLRGYTASSVLTLTFTPQAAKNVNAATAGVLVLLFEVIEASKYTKY